MFKSFYTILILIAAVVVSGCVTTSGRSVSKADKKKAHDAHVSLGLTYLQTNNREASRRHLEKALAINPNSPQAHNGIALLYQVTGEIALSEKSFLMALRKDSDFTQAWVDYGRFLYQQKRYKEAYDAFERSSQDVSYQKRALALTYLGQTALLLGNKIKAKSVFKHAANLDNKLALPMIELGDLYFDEKRYEESKYYLDRYIEIKGRTPRALWLGIRIERIFGDKDKEASYALALKNLYPYSQEYLKYKQALENY
ncbi:type IV pilus biogenesis/stability protein PilW [Candidatus Endobugula sertula]|uniref:Type IV pilus biogenesis/stability protein PilW n=1 Tax=Candidatus Endobugula sertula TaxID=62101 RepID=A0A1D2QLP3_9GAMM|nr:type IV pilus biogenesis/stability protein PilW [Candidatus Endobugula sertula]